MMLTIVLNYQEVKKIMIRSKEYTTQNRHRMTSDVKFNDVTCRHVQIINSSFLPTCDDIRLQIFRLNKLIIAKFLFSNLYISQN